MNLVKDYEASKRIILNEPVEGYDKICYSTNEDLVSSLKNIRLYQKNVLSVMGSCDQVFTFNYCGANVDSFDKNILSLYYYYLRRWNILYGDDAYPTALIENNYCDLNMILNEVRPTSSEENIALQLWKKLVYDKTDFSKLFFHMDFMGNTLFSEREDLLGTVKKEPNFMCINLFKPLNLNKKYEIIYLSNIIEWARNKKDVLYRLRDNLDKLLDEKGIIICTNIVNLNDEEERLIFGEKFDITKNDRFSYKNLSFAFCPAPKFVHFIN